MAAHSENALKLLRNSSRCSGSSTTSLREMAAPLKMTRPFEKVLRRLHPLTGQGASL